MAKCICGSRSRVVGHRLSQRSDGTKYWTSEYKCSAFQAFVKKGGTMHPTHIRKKTKEKVFVERHEGGVLVVRKMNGKFIKSYEHKTMGKFNKRYRSITPSEVRKRH